MKFALNTFFFILPTSGPLHDIHTLRGWGKGEIPQPSLLPLAVWDPLGGCPPAGLGLFPAGSRPKLVDKHPLRGP